MTLKKHTLVLNPEDPHHKDLDDHIRSFPNKSEYLKRLVDRDFHQKKNAIRVPTNSGGIKIQL